MEPEFPHRLLQDRGGSVTVRFMVQPDGSVRSVEALKSSNSRLVRGVVDAVSRWRFAPIAQARSAVVEVGFKAE
ncbi:UNVERIFIED_ORG: energy transducer TonB [Shinella sp. XGS7]